MSRIGLVTHDDCLAHDAGPAHPERPDRLRAVLRRLEESGLADELDRVEAEPLEEASLTRAHTPEHVARVRAACDSAPAALDADTIVSPGSWRAARLAAGGLVDATRRVVSGDWSKAFCAVRPPGHHAERGRPMGFCLFNSVALAAYAALEAGLERVAILDWDVHHGNGTQDVFEADARVFYASLHQAPLYPGTGNADERGHGAGEGTTLNAPQPAGSGDAQWVAALERQVLPALEAFDPELLLVSAGFDAHRDDPLAGCNLTSEGYAALTRATAGLARGRVVSVLEGGYHLGALADSVEAHVGVLLRTTPTPAGEDAST